MNTDDPRFASFNVTLSNPYKSLRSDGVDAESRPTEPITNAEEEQLWVSIVLNTTTPKGLLRSVFFYVGKTFCLRGGQKHRDLSLTQLQRLKEPDRFEYTENSSKNRQGGIKAGQTGP